MPTLPPAAPLLDWYDRHRRVLPFRHLGGQPDPYRVWLSEVMLQQTTVAAVGARFERFLSRFPDVSALAAAPEASVMEEWAGLGYYARARNLHACARQVVALGSFPQDAEALRQLPGIGHYTAAAIAAIAFGKPVVPADGNVERVVARLLADESPLPQAKAKFALLASEFMRDGVARARPGDFAQALFDLGATLCTPRAPACALCPWQKDCAARQQGVQDKLPRKSTKRPRPLRHGTHFMLRDAAGRVLLRRRPPRGLLGGMLEFPGTPWRDTPWIREEALAHAPLAGLLWQAIPGTVRHGFTHFELELDVLVTETALLTPAEGEEVRLIGTIGPALPTVMRKLLGLPWMQDHATAPQSRR